MNGDEKCKSRDTALEKEEGIHGSNIVHLGHVMNINANDECSNDESSLENHDVDTDTKTEGNDEGVDSDNADSIDSSIRNKDDEDSLDAKDAPAQDQAGADMPDAKDTVGEEDRLGDMEKKSIDVEGAILIGIAGSEETGIDYREHDFTSILCTIRDLEGPIILSFERPQLEQESHIECMEKEPNTAADNIGTEIEHQHGDGAAIIKGRLQRWGTQFAGEAATRARKAVIAGRDLAKEKVNEIQQIQQNDNVTEAVKVQAEVETKKEVKKEEPEICGLFLQTSSGKCIPLTEQLYGPRRVDNSSRKNLFRKNAPTITNTSVLVIRISLEQPCPALGYKYQWYRTKSSPFGYDDQALKLNDSWLKLDGATSVVFQPSATDVGFRVKCVATIEKPPKMYSAFQVLPLVVTCELPFKIESDKVLFDAAHKTFRPINGDVSRVCVSSFDNMVGAEGLENTKLRLDLHTFRSLEKEGHRCFFMTAFGDSEVSYVVSFYGGWQRCFFHSHHFPSYAIPSGASIRR